MLPQDESVEDSPQTLEEILRQIPPSNQIQSIIDEAQRSQEIEVIQEREEIFNNSQQNQDIELNKDRIETIRSAMANFTLPNSAIPSWASNMSEADWQKKLESVLQKK